MLYLCPPPLHFEQSVAKKEAPDSSPWVFERSTCSDFNSQLTSKIFQIFMISTHPVEALAF
jgi:hypothetical protein